MIIFVIMDIIEGLYQDWVSARNGTWFTTRSQYPEIPCFISPVALRTCSNYGSYLPYKASVELVLEYLEDQVRILHYNNPGHTRFMVKSAIDTRIAHWVGNAVLKRDSYFLGRMLEEVIDDCFNDPDFAQKISFGYTKYWYSDQIMNMSGNGRSGSVRSKAKQQARQAMLCEGYTDDLRNASVEYRGMNFDVRPTIKILSTETGYSDPTVRKYGKDFYIMRVANIGQRVERARSVYPGFTQQQIADLLKETRRTVRMYWK